MASERTGPTWKREAELPAFVRPLFWQYDFEALTWEQDRDLTIARVLASGGWDVITWLPSQPCDRKIG